ncbi:YfjI family protein [Xanthomonas sp. CFBP 7912]|uniref:YfjI family protein n=1 Tax=Xanthomonas sp. CFBP 7912 TaxID=1891621 RepID=UPI000CEF4F45|nr:YfjI family protein [Xanthomonas sp. CFBP 7912]PPU37816.1 hypothetical protein XspCFBP7912_01740 [Xanthomonas sp. CFBP 7912]
MTRRNPDNFPANALYPLIRDAVVEMQDNLQAPLALIASSFGTAMSAACQGLVVVETPTGQERPASLFFATIADSGERKTACDNLVGDPLLEYDARLASISESDIHTHQAEMSYWKAKDKVLQRKLQKAIEADAEDEVTSIRAQLIAHNAEKPQKFKHTQLIHQSITERPLMEALRGDGKSVVIMSSEGEIILKGGVTNKFGVINEAWDCPKILSFQRADVNYVARHPNMTLSLMVQEEVFKNFMEKRGRLARGSGFLARFLVAWPSSTMGFRYMTLDEPVWEKLKLFHARVRELLELRLQARTTPVRLTFTQEAKELWVNRQNRFEVAVRKDGQLFGIRDFAAKALDNASRLAAILHFFSGQPGLQISHETLERALTIVNWHINEALQMFSGDDIPEDEDDAHKLTDFMHRKYYSRGRSTVRRNILRKEGPIRHQGRFEAALDYLQDTGVILVRYHNEESGSGPLCVEMNPRIFDSNRL